MLLFGSYVSFQFLVTLYLQIGRLVGAEIALAFLPAGALVASRAADGRCWTGSGRPGRRGRLRLPGGRLPLFLRIGPHPDYPA